MEFTDKALEPLGAVLLDTTLETDLGLKTALVFRIIKLLKENGYLPEYGHHMAEVCLEEALANAMMHGNKLDPAKKVHVTAFGDAERFGIIIQDQGEGFKAQDLPDHDDPKALLRERGRGIVLITHYMDQVQFNTKGNKVRMVRKIQQRPDPGARKPQELPPTKAIPVKLDLSGIDLTIPDIAKVGKPARLVLPDEIALEYAGADADPKAGDPVKPSDSDPNAVVVVHERDGVVVARFQAARLTEDNAEEIRNILQQAVARGKGLVLDMAEVEFTSSVGISTLLGAHKQVTMQKKRIVLASMGPALRNVLKATGLLKVFQIEADQDAAIKKVKG